VDLLLESLIISCLSARDHYSAFWF